MPQQGSQRQPTVNLTSSWRKELLADADDEPETKKLLDFLLRDDVRVSSLAIVDRPGVGVSTLKVDDREDSEQGSDLSFVPVCSNDGSPPFASFSLLEPNLAWLGIGLGGTGTGSLEVRINGVVAEVMEQRQFGFRLISNWIRIPTMPPVSATEYNISLCRNGDSFNATLNQIVGVMLPTMSSREVGLFDLLSS